MGNVDCAPQLCYLYADLYKQTNSKETRRIFMDFHTFFMDRAAVSAGCVTAGPGRRYPAGMK